MLQELCQKLINKTLGEFPKCQTVEQSAALENFVEQLKIGKDLLKTLSEQEEVVPGYDKTMECLGLINKEIGAQYLADVDPDGVWVYEKSLLPQVALFNDFLDAAAFLEPFAYQHGLSRESFESALQDYRATDFVRFVRKEN